MVNLKSFTKLMESSPMIVIIALVSVGFTAWSMAEVIIAYLALSARVEDYGFIVRSWKQEPIQDVVVVNASQSCPTGYAQLSARSWPGVEEGPCVCPYGATQGGESEFSSSDACDGNQTAAGCVSAPTIWDVRMSIWRYEKQFCFRRGGSPTFLNPDGPPPYRTRPVPLPDKPCPEDFRHCGPENATYPKAICMPVEDECPVTALGMASNLTASEYTTIIPIEGSTLSVGIQRANTSRGLPVVYEAKALYSEVCLGLPGGSRGRWWDQEATGNAYMTSDLEARCVIQDDRFKSWTSVRSSEVLSANVNDHSDMCTNNPTDPILSVSSCSAEDTICNNLNNLGRCAYVNGYANNAPDRVHLLTMTEVEWDPDCPVKQGNLARNEEPVYLVRDLQLAIVIINCVVGSVGAMVQCLVVANHFLDDLPCVPYSGEAEKQFIVKTKSGFDGVCKLAKIIPELVIIIIVSGVRFFFDRLSTADCSDRTTDETFLFIGQTMASAYDANIRAVVIDFVLLLYSIYTVVAFVWCRKESGVEIEMTNSIKGVGPKHMDGVGPHSRAHFEVENPNKAEKDAGAGAERRGSIDGAAPERRGSIGSV